MKKKDSNAKANDNVESVVGEVLSNEEVQEQMALAQLAEVKALNKSIITKYKLSYFYSLFIFNIKIINIT